MIYGGYNRRMKRSAAPEQGIMNLIGADLGEHENIQVGPQITLRPEGRGR
jgi:hypothetical protein